MVVFAHCSLLFGSYLYRNVEPDIFRLIHVTLCGYPFCLLFHGVGGICRIQEGKLCLKLVYSYRVF